MNMNELKSVARVCMMTLANHLSAEALELPGDFLLDCVSEHDYDESIDEGVLVIPELDGFLPVIVCGPVMGRRHSGFPHCGVISSRPGRTNLHSRSCWAGAYGT